MRVTQPDDKRTTEDTSRRRSAAVYFKIGAVLIILLVVALRANGLLKLGTQSDEGLHITVAERVAAGDRLYRDLFENRTPGVELLLAAAFRLFGPSVLLARFLSLASNALTIAALIVSGRVARQLLVGRVRSGKGLGLDHAAGWAAGLFFGLAPLAIFWSRYTMLEHWQTAAASLAVTAALLAVAKDKAGWWLLSGVMAALAILAKQSGVVVAVALAIYLIGLKLGPPKGFQKRALLYWLAGLVLPVIPFLLWLVAQGALADFSRFLSAADRLAPLANALEKGESAGRWLVRRPLFIFSVAGGLAVLRSRRWLNWLPLLWAGGEVVALLAPPVLDLGWGGFSHYALPALAPLSLLAGVGMAQLIDWARGSRAQKVLAAGLRVVAIIFAIGWFSDLRYSVTQREYPQAGFEAERRIGRAAAAITAEDDPILVLANAAIYHWAGREPATRFFQLPGYLPESELWPEAEAELLATLNEADLQALAISRLHLEERMSDTLRNALHSRWQPVAFFEYPYQRDVFLFQPKDEVPGIESRPLAEFDAGIALLDAEIRPAGDEVMEVKLWWTAPAEAAGDWIVFVHLLDVDGQLIAQHDGVPAVGFRPVSSWGAGEVVLDTHWIEISAGELDIIKQVAIGLYDPATGRRSFLRNVPGEIDSVILAFEQGIE